MTESMTDDLWEASKRRFYASCAVVEASFIKNGGKGYLDAEEMAEHEAAFREYMEQGRVATR